MTRLARIARRDEGYSLTEMMVVLGIMAAVGGMAVVQITASRPAMVGDGGMRVVMSQITQAREMAITQRRNMRLTFSNNNTVVVTREEVSPVGTTVLSTVPMEGGVQFALISGQTDTPDGFGRSTATTFKVNSVNATQLRFQPDGTFVNEDGLLMNGTVFLALPGQGLSSRAVTIMGSTGRIRGYRWNGSIWKPV